MKYLIALPFLATVAGCATTRSPEPVVVTQVVKEPVSVPCVPENYDRRRPDYIDSDRRLREAADAAERYQLLWGGRAQRQAREQVNEAALSGCLQ